MRLIDAEIAYDKIAEQETSYYMDMEGVQAGLDETPTVDAVPVTDVDELKMRLSGAEAAVNGMREQINRMVIINSEKVSVVRCKNCLRYYKGRNGWTCGLTGCTHNGEWFCADGERKTK